MAADFSWKKVGIIKNSSHIKNGSCNYIFDKKFEKLIKFTTI